ncbi:MAG: hypothetical protein ACO3K0_00475, partial [Steroidobacteraceae bacterium]
MSKHLTKSSITSMIVLALASSVAMAGGKPIDGGGGGGKGGGGNKGGGDTGSTVVATLGLGANNTAVCSWSAKGLTGTEVAFCEGLDMTVEYSCNGGQRATASGPFVRKVDSVSVKRNGSGTATLIESLPSVSG